MKNRIFNPSPPLFSLDSKIERMGKVSRLSVPVCHCLLALSVLSLHSAIPVIAAETTGAAPEAETVGTLPNIVLVFMDDQGYGDLGVYGAEGFDTPNLDKMAEEGVRFTDFYAASSICSPSRAALLTGKYPTRVGVPEVIGPNAERFMSERLAKGLPQEALTIAELLKTQGYATALIGKWHLGHEEGFQPIDQGFDYFLGIPYSNDMPIMPDARLSAAVHLRHGATVEKIRANAYHRDVTNPSGKPYVAPERYFTPLMEGRHVVEFPVDQRGMTRRFTDAAISFMERTRNQPFFLYLAHPMPHVPMAPSYHYIGRSRGGAYGDVMEEVDTETGRLLDALKALGLEENTLVIFTSDNGPWKMPAGFGGSAGPLRGYKFLTHEGGHRVPMLARWPGQIPAGSVISEVATMMDFFPTFAGLAEVEVPESLHLDGFDLWPLLTGAEGASSAYEDFFYLRGWEVQAVRRGPWKLQLAGGGSDFRLVIDPEAPGKLYNLAEDIGESEDVSAAHPAIAAELRKRIEAFQEVTDRDAERWK